MKTLKLHLIFRVTICLFSLSTIALFASAPTCEEAYRFVGTTFSSIPEAYGPKAIAIAENPFGSIEKSQFISRFHPPKVPRDMGFNTPGFKTKEYLAQLSQFANEVNVPQVMTYQSPITGTWIKFHATTGDLLITTREGKIAIYTLLPVDRPGTVPHETTLSLFDRITKTILLPSPASSPSVSFDNLTAGEAFSSAGFQSEDSLRNQAIKHVLGVESNDAIWQITIAMQKRNRDYVAEEFPELYKDFKGLFMRPESGQEQKQIALNDLIDSYKKSALNFMTSQKQTILTATRTRTSQNGNQESSRTLGFRFDTLTNELAIFDRNTGSIITYFRVTMSKANEWLKKHQQPLVKSPIEFFLTLIDAPQEFEK